MTDHEDIVALRARIHNLSDMVQGHEGDLREHKVLLEQHAHQLDTVTGQMATREQLTTSVNGMSERLERFHVENTLKLQNVDIKLAGIAVSVKENKDAMNDAINPIRAGIVRLVWLIIAAIVATIMGMVLAKPMLPATPVLTPAPLVQPQSVP